jgi:hypothetical protein
VGKSVGGFSLKKIAFLGEYLIFFFNIYRFYFLKDVFWENNEKIFF